MPKLRKQRRKKVYRHNVNRKRLRDKISNLGKIGCKDIKEAWHFGKSVKRNLQDMGLSYNPNETIKIPKVKDKLIKMKLEDVPSIIIDKWKVENLKEPVIPIKGHIVGKLEEDASAPRVKLFRLPKGQVEWITYLMDKHGMDYKAMVRDRKNYNQETWKQLRAKINKFKSIPEQYEVYLKARGLENKSINDVDDLRCDSD